jgi:hypothetical protein
MISSDWQLEQTGVDRVARRLTICAGSGFGLNGFSQKREYFKYPPETIGHFAPEVTKFGVWRPTTNSQKTAIGGHFWPCRRQNLNAPDWLAGAGGFKPPYGGSKSIASLLRDPTSNNLAQN